MRVWGMAVGVCPDVEQSARQALGHIAGTGRFLVKFQKTPTAVASSLFRHLIGRRLEGNRRRLEGNRRRLEGNRRRLEGNRRRLEGNRWRLEGNRRRLEGNRRRLEGDDQYAPVSEQREVLFPSNFGTLALLSQGPGGGGGGGGATEGGWVVWDRFPFWWGFTACARAVRTRRTANPP